MKKITILLVILMMISVGLFSGCTEENTDNNNTYTPYWHEGTAFDINYDTDHQFSIRGEATQWKISWTLISGSPGIYIYLGIPANNNIFNIIGNSGNGYKIYDQITKTWDTIYYIRTEGFYSITISQYY